MFELARPVGIGLAAHGEVADVVRWADGARRRAIAKIDIETAQLHAAFDLLYMIGLSLGHML
jgi:hypothetical protein